MQIKNIISNLVESNSLYGVYKGRKDEVYCILHKGDKIIVYLDKNGNGIQPVCIFVENGVLFFGQLSYSSDNNILISIFSAEKFDVDSLESVNRYLANKHRMLLVDYIGMLDLDKAKYIVPENYSCLYDIVSVIKKDTTIKLRFT